MKRVRIKSIERDGDRAVILTYRGDGEKNQIEVPGGFDDFKNWVRSSVSENIDLAVLLALNAWLDKNKSWREMKAIEGKTIKLDLEGDTSAGILVIE